MYWFSAIALASFIAYAAPGQAAALSAEKATELLAKAWMVDNRCDVLAKQDRDDLTQFVARAEISVAEKASVKIAQNAISRGREQGKAATCDAASATMVREVLDAARTADSPTQLPAPAQAAEKEPIVEPQVDLPVAQDEAEPAQAIAASKPVRPVATAKVQTRKIAPPKPVREAKQVAKQKAVVVAKAKPVKALNTTYARTAETYYKELRCRRASQRTINAMYARVLREHQQAVAQKGKSAVRSMLRAAENRAAQSSC